MNTILYIDEDMHYARMVNKFLTSYGFNVETAYEGAEGVKKARELQPDLILVDLCLPRVRGLEVITQIREEALTCYIPIVVISALPASQSRQLTEGIGVQDFIPKPFKIQDLINTVRRNIAQRVCASSDAVVH